MAGQGIRRASPHPATGTRNPLKSSKGIRGASQPANHGNRKRIDDVIL
jgi:hypothetical protein